MPSHYAMHRRSLVTALLCLMTFVESKPASIGYVASTSVSRCLKTAPRITEPPTPGPIELMKVKRQEIGFDTCAYIDDEPLGCVNSGTCTSLKRHSDYYVGCCYGDGNCDIHTGCYDQGAAKGVRPADPRILSCVGSNPFCATILWSQQPKTWYLCAERPRTITVDRTAASPNPSSTTEFSSNEPKPTFGPVPPDRSDEPQGPRPIAG